MNATYEDLWIIDGIGPKIAQKIIDTINAKYFIETVTKLKAAGLSFEYKKKNIAERLNGSFVGTGTLLSMTRNEVKDIIHKNGGSVSSAISSKTNYLVAGEKAGSKLNKAKALGINIITENELLEMCKGDD